MKKILILTDLTDEEDDEDVSEFVVCTLSPKVAIPTNH